MRLAIRRGQERAWANLWSLGVRPPEFLSEDPPPFWPGDDELGTDRGGDGVPITFPNWYSSPWTDDASLLREMREADDAERDVDIVDG
jgi:hypothetical protein